MTKYALLLTLTIAPGWLRSQDFSLPILYLDSLIYLSNRGLACDTLVKAQIREISAIEAQLVSQTKIIQLQRQQISQQAYVIGEQIKQLQVERDLARVKNEWLKRKIWRQKRMVAIESGIIGVLIAVLII